MGSFDNNTIAQVWQRVAAPPEDQNTPDSLMYLIQEAGEQERLYWKLSGTLSGNAQGLCRQLRSQQQKTLSALRGLMLLCGGSTTLQRNTELPAQNAVNILKSCYQRSRQAIWEYTARSVSPDSGPVFRVLAQREEAQCALIAEILGTRSQ